ncbi:macro domain-like protein [Serendipita vermifera]|nr:macro domain-like protein [Serendipita vermifera]
MAEALPQVESCAVPTTKPVHYLFLEPRWSDDQSIPDMLSEWPTAIKKYFPDPKEAPFTVVEGFLGKVDNKILECECMVSPANSFGIMDGGYDMALTNNFRGPENNKWKLTNIVQDHLRDEWHGYLPPGCCTIVSLPPDLAGDKNPWKAHCMAVLPTMRVPSNVQWNKDLVYNCMWSLQVAIDSWNRTHPENQRINRVLTTGLGTGTGGVHPTVAAEQMVLAVKHFMGPPVDHPRWGDAIYGLDDEIEATYAEEKKKKESKGWWR